jgi:hypothetical protein
MGPVIWCLVFVMSLQSSPTTSGQTETAKDVVAGWQGKWTVTAMARGGGVESVEFTAGAVMPSDDGAITFTVESSDRDPSTGQHRTFSGGLKPAPDTYLLSVKAPNVVIVDLRLKYTGSAGFSGTGSALNGVPVEATVTRMEGAYRLRIVNPQLPEDKRTILFLAFNTRKPG